MATDFFINGETLVSVKGPSGSLISSLTPLGLTVEEGVPNITPQIFHDECLVDAWGDAPVDVQLRLGTVNIRMTLVFFDPAILEECWRLSMGGPTVVGEVARAGWRMGGGFIRFAPANNYIGLNLYSPIAGRPYRFFFTYLTEQPIVWPVGTKRSMVQLNWKAIPYILDPWNAGVGAANYPIWDRVLDV